MANYTVRVTFKIDESGSNEYIFPLVQSIQDNKEGSKAVIHEGTRGDGSIYIPAGKKSQTIKLSGILYDNDGYEDLTTKINALKTAITTDPGTLTLEHFNPDATGGGEWITDWQYTVVRVAEINFSESMRTERQDYEVSFLVLSY